MKIFFELLILLTIVKETELEQYGTSNKSYLIIEKKSILKPRYIESNGRTHKYERKRIGGRVDGLKEHAFPTLNLLEAHSVVLMPKQFVCVIARFHQIYWRSEL